MTIINSVLVFARRRRWSVLVSTAALSAVAALVCLRISFETDILKLLPRDTAALSGFHQYLSEFGEINHLYIVFTAAEGRGIEDAGELVDSFTGKLRALDEISEVDTGFADTRADWTYLQDRVLLLLGPDIAGRALDRFDPEKMREALRRSRDLLTAPSNDVKNLVRTDPLGFLTLLRERFAGDQTFGRLTQTARGYLSDDGRSRLIIATPTAPPFDGAFCRRLFERLTDAERQAKVATSISESQGIEIAYAGGHRIALETETIMRREAAWNSVTSVAAILLLLLLVFRSVWIFMAGAIPMAVATLGSIAINGLIHDRLSAAATGTSALLFGLGIDGLVLMYVRFLEACASGDDPDTAVGRLSDAGSSMLLGCVTTAATFFALTWIDLPGLQELGRLVGVGMLLGGPLTLLLVPALLPARAPRQRPLTATGLAHVLHRHRRLILATAAVLTIAAVPFARRVNIDLRLQRLQPDTPATRLQNELPKRFGIDRDVAIVVTEGNEIQSLLDRDRQLDAALRASGFNMPHTGPSALLPPEAEQAATAAVVADRASQVPALQARVREMALDEGFRAGTVDGFINRMPRMLDPALRLSYEGYVDHGLAPLVNRFVSSRPGAVTTAAYVEVDDAAAISRVRSVAATVSPTLTVTGVPVINLELAQRFPRQLAIALVAGAIAVFLLMFAMFRQLSTALLALGPMVIGLVWAAAVMSILRVSVDLFGVFAVLTLIGIGVDYGIHLVHRARRADVQSAVARIVPANLVAAGIALLGCGSLVPSAYPPLRSLGILTVVGLLTCLVAAVVVLPAMLMSFPSGDRDRPAKT
jgi:predicted exporter